MYSNLELGYRIPKGAGILMNVYTIHNDPKKFPDPKKFDPDRFKDDKENLFFTATNPERRGTFTFGAGRRACQVSSLARNNN